jgi:hypothetical protein
MFPFDTLFTRFADKSSTPQMASAPGLVFHTLLAVLVFAVLMVLVGALTGVRSSPPRLLGWPSGTNYDALITTRKPLADYLSTYTPTPADPTRVPMRYLTVATANYGGIFTEAMSPPFHPFVGTVDPEAARLQVEAGARAMVLDIWPDPENRANPVVCAMIDTTRYPSQRWWVSSGGLGRGVGRFSNWQLVTRNKVPADRIMNAALRAAFNTPNSPQNGDPFFLILRLHGAMTTDYLNKLGTYVQAAIGPNGMSSEWNRNANANALATEPITTFANKCFVVVCPDIEPNFNSLPGINTFEQFTPVFLNTTLGEATNLLETTQNTVIFTPNNGGSAKALTPKGFCIAQGSVGGTSTDNDKEFAVNSFQQCIQYGIQFVAVNLLSPKDDEGTLQTFFSQKFFKTHSFAFTSPPPPPPSA